MDEETRESWLRDSCLQKAIIGREGWAAEQVLKVAQTYYNWVKTGRTDIVH